MVESTTAWTGRTVFSTKPHVDLSSFASGSEHEVQMMQWSPKQHRQLIQQIKEGTKPRAGENVHVIEVFSPPRFALECGKMGWNCVSADLCTGWDFRKSQDRKAMIDLVTHQKPELLLLCPPCTRAGGWFNLNKHKMTAEEIREREILTRLFISFCKQLLEIQLANGVRILRTLSLGPCCPVSLPKCMLLTSTCADMECVFREAS